MKKMMEQFLKEAFSGESQAHMKYLIFAAIAKKEGLPNVARLFEATAYAELVHATNHAKVLGFMNPTVENLKAGIGGETFEVEDMYPAYDAYAKEIEDKGAQKAIRYALEAEKVHAEYYSEALEKVEKGKDEGEEAIHVCPECGHTHRGEAPDTCPICGVKKEKFRTF